MVKTPTLSPQGSWVPSLVGELKSHMLSGAAKQQKRKIHHLEGPGGEGNGTPLQYSCLENPMDGGAW